mgnify:CR=1 FL=1
MFILQIMRDPHPSSKSKQRRSNKEFEEHLQVLQTTLHRATQIVQRDYELRKVNSWEKSRVNYLQINDVAITSIPRKSKLTLKNFTALEQKKRTKVLLDPISTPSTPTTTTATKVAMLSKASPITQPATTTSPRKSQRLTTLRRLPINSNEREVSERTKRASLVTKECELTHFLFARSLLLCFVKNAPRFARRRYLS